MTKDDDLFDIRYVIFDADDAQSLIGKDVFVSDSLFNLRQAVNAMDIANPNYYGQLMSAVQVSTSHVAKFKIHCDDRKFEYIYYDPYYELKCAVKQGKTIEYMYDVDNWYVKKDPDFVDKPEYYRIKSEELKKPALKWQDLKIGDILRGPLIKGLNHNNDFYGVITMIDADKATNCHICFGNQWVQNDDICKFRRVNERGEDVE